jgi:flavin reductase (DIM6/NTAB) family NADH-FMN oxidoreductase RutF
MKAIFNITYGLYVLSTKTNKHNACIINTLMQVTSTPNRISITINKDNETTKMIEESGMFNVSILDMSTPFDLIKRFGFSSGKDVNKFEGFEDYRISSNGLTYITKHTNAYISAKVISKTDLGTHITFVADVVDDVVLSDTLPVTYAYYHSNIKPKAENVKKGVYVCKICNYVYDGDELPEDFICPICKHGSIDFEYKE